MARRDWAVRAVAVCVLLAGVALLGAGLVQPIKGAIGQRLLASTFDDRLSASAEDRADDANWRPWPWADLAPIAELHFPKTGQRRVVVDSASGEALAWGAGHMSETAALGAPGVSVIAGHRDGVFSLLGDVHLGDVVELTTLDGQTQRYIIEERLVVDSRFAQVPLIHDGPDELVLSTCWPIQAIASGPERLVLHARPSPS